MRLFSLTNQNSTTLTDIHQTSTDQIIEWFEKQHESITSKNDEMLNKFSNRVTNEKDKFYKKLKELKIDPKQGSPLLVYYNFEKQMIRDWMDQVENKRFGVKCEICSRRDRLIKCKVIFPIIQKCNLSVHAHCYPKLPKNYLEKDFICENCEKILDEKTQCIFCPIRGGQFFQVDYPNKRTAYSNYCFNLAITKT